VAALVEERFGVRLGVTAVGRLLAELEITLTNDNCFCRSTTTRTAGRP
jgi:hypothetical protein